MLNPIRAYYLLAYSVKGRPHYYSTKKEEYAHIRFDLDAGTLSRHIRTGLSINSLSDKVLGGLSRLLIPLRLEHETALRLRPRLVPTILILLLLLLPDSSTTSLTIYNLGHHHSLHRPLSTEPLLLLKTDLHKTHLLYQTQSSERQGPKQTRNHPPPEPETKVPDLRSFGSPGRAGERDAGGGVECAAVGRSLDVDAVGKSRPGQVEVEGIDGR